MNPARASAACLSRSLRQPQHVEVVLALERLQFGITGDEPGLELERSHDSERIGIGDGMTCFQFRRLPHPPARRILDGDWQRGVSGRTLSAGALAPLPTAGLEVRKQSASGGRTAVGGGRNRAGHRDLRAPG
jgi:hypothetical protein